jgi:hypothetical protein
MEGIPDRSNVFLSRGAREAVSAVLRSPDPRQPSSRTRTRGEHAAPVKTGEAGDAEGARQGCQRLGRTRLRGKKTPTLLHSRETQGCTVHVSCDDPPKRSRAS